MDSRASATASTHIWRKRRTLVESCRRHRQPKPSLDLGLRCSTEWRLATRGDKFDLRGWLCQSAPLGEADRGMASLPPRVWRAIAN